MNQGTNSLTVSFNGEQTVLSESETLQSFLQNHNLLSKKGIAVAVNETVISRDRWSQTNLTQGDSILIVTATQGG